MTRNNLLRIFAGNLGTGKTTACLTYAEKFLSYNPINKILVVDDAGHPSYKDFDTVSINGIHKSKSRYVRCEEANEDELFHYIQHYVSNTFVIFEDAGKYMSANSTNAQKSCIKDMRKNNKDFSFMFHYLSEVPIAVIKHHQELILFKTLDDFTSKQGKWANWHIIKNVGLEIAKNKNPHYSRIIKM
jgi:hypothetical protein